jgi:hypothetical protein
MSADEQHDATVSFSQQRLTACSLVVCRRFFSLPLFDSIERKTPTNTHTHTHVYAPNNRCTTNLVVSSDCPTCPTAGTCRRRQIIVQKADVATRRLDAHQQRDAPVRSSSTQIDMYWHREMIQSEQTKLERYREKKHRCVDCVRTRRKHERMRRATHRYARRTKQIRDGRDSVSRSHRCSLTSTLACRQNRLSFVDC